MVWEHELIVGGQGENSDAYHESAANEDVLLRHIIGIQDLLEVNLGCWFWQTCEAYNNLLPVTQSLSCHQKRRVW